MMRLSRGPAFAKRYFLPDFEQNPPLDVGAQHRGQHRLGAAPAAEGAERPSPSPAHRDDALALAACPGRDATPAGFARSPASGPASTRSAGEKKARVSGPQSDAGGCPDQLIRARLGAPLPSDTSSARDRATNPDLGNRSASFRTS